MSFPANIAEFSRTAPINRTPRVAASQYVTVKHVWWRPFFESHRLQVSNCTEDTLSKLFPSGL